jgi:hypothetical protein
MNSTFADQIVENMRQKPTEELLAIWARNDREQWSDAAFEAIFKTLSERGVNVPPQGAFEQPPPRYKGVSGWLLLFSLSLVVFNPLSVIDHFGAAYGSAKRMFDLLQYLPVVVTFEVILNIAFAAFSIYAGICLWRVAPGAVKKAKMFLWCSLAWLALLAVLLMTSWPASAKEFIGVARGVVYCLIWLAYLDGSKRVKATYEM